MVEGDNVERELAEALERQREATDRWGNRLEALMGEIRKDAQAHYQDDAAAFATLGEMAKSAHKRIDEHVGEHRDEKAGRMQLWIGVVLSFVAAVLSAIFAAFGGRKS